MQFKDATLTSLIARHAVLASDYYDSLTIFDAPEPARMSYTKTCRLDMDKALADVLAWVEKAYVPRGEYEA